MAELADTDGLVSVSWQWLADGGAIAGATDSSFLLTQAQVGKTITVKATYYDVKATSYDDSGAFVSLSSAATSRVVSPAPTEMDDYLLGTPGADSLSGRAGNDTLDGGAGRDTLDGGVGVDAVSYQSTSRLPGQSRGVSVDLGAGVQKELLDRNTFVGKTASLFALGIKVADLDVTKMGFVMNGAWITRNFPGKALWVDKSVAKQVTFWVAMFDGTYTKAVQLRLEDTAQGVTVVALKAKYAKGNVTDGSLNFNTDGITASAGVATHARGGAYGVASISAEATGDTLRNIENVTGSDYNDTITGNAVANELSGGAGNDTLKGGAGNDTLDGGAGSDTLDGGDGVDTVSYQSTSRLPNESRGVSVNLGTGVQTELAGAAGGDTLRSIENVIGSRYNDTITGNAAANQLSGGAGNDTLKGSAGNDTLNGGDGNDTLDGGAGSDTLDGGEGVDTVSYQSTSRSSGQSGGVFVDLGTGVQKELLNRNTFVGTTATLFAPDIKVADLDVTKMRFVMDGGWMQSATGKALWVAGGGSKVTFWVAVFDGTNTKAVQLKLEDTAQGVTVVALQAKYAKGDFTSGNLTNFQNKYITAKAGVATHPDTGAYGVASISAEVAGDTLLNIENVTASGYDDTITGNDGDNELYGHAGNDILDGGAGADYLFGGLGDDTYIVDNVGDEVIEFAGTDTVKASINYTLRNHVENLILTGADNINGTGNSLDNIITGNDGNNELNGQAGNDTLDGGAGNDTACYSTLTTGVEVNLAEGKQWSFFTTLNNISALTPGYLSGNFNVADIDFNTVSLTIFNYETQLVLVSKYVSVISNANGKATCWVAATNGQYTFAQKLVFEDTRTLVRVTSVEQKFAEGDVSDFNAVNWIDDNDNIINDTGIVALSGHTRLQVGSLSNIENIVGTYSYDKLIGNDGNNKLYGLWGDDTLDGGNGADTLAGGDGNDYYFVDNVGDVVVEFANEGTDTVVVNFDYTLGDNVENLKLTGPRGIDGTGNKLNNYIIGNDYSNSLNGGEGADTLAGGDGSDYYFVDNVGDVVVELAYQGNHDTVTVNFDYTLGANVEVLMLTDGINGTGNDLNNKIYGNSGDNVLCGEAGSDLIYGDNGNDILVGGSGNDLIRGGDGDDTIYGGLGDDDLFGGFGADLFVMDTPFDGEIDHLSDFIVSDGDKICLDSTVFNALIGHTDITNFFKYSNQSVSADFSYIIYNPLNGDLSYDSTGISATSAIVFASLMYRGQDLTAQQFVVV
jgi:Ca2+-binding RTX toxin-like protein